MHNFGKKGLEKKKMIAKVNQTDMNQKGKTIHRAVMQ